jgi:hypothetical protein
MLKTADKAIVVTISTRIPAALRRAVGDHLRNDPLAPSLNRWIVYAMEQQLGREQDDPTTRRLAPGRAAPRRAYSGSRRLGKQR